MDDTKEEIMENEDEVMVTEQNEESTGLSNGAKIGIGVGITALVGLLAYKVGKPALVKIQAKRKQKKLAKSATDEVKNED